MAVTPMNRGDALNVELWSSRLRFLEMMKRFNFGQMARRGVLARAEELDRAQAGDKITIQQIGRLTGIGVGEGGTLEGQEEAEDLNGFSMVFNVFRHAVAFYNKDTVEQARTMVKFDEVAEELLRDYHGSRLNSSVFNQLAGVNSTTIDVQGTIYSGSNRTFVQGLNTINAPSTNRIVRAGGQANDQSLTTADTMTLDLIDVALEKLQTTYPTAESLDGDEFDLYLHHYQALDLRRDNSGRIQWYTNYLAAIEGGAGDNPIMNGSYSGAIPIGRYQNVNIYANNYVPNGVSSADSSRVTTARRAVLCGKNAALFASKFSGALTGEETQGGRAPLQFFYDDRDYGYVRGTEGRMIYGIKKHQFDSEDYSSVVIGTYAAAHTS